MTTPRTADGPETGHRQGSDPATLQRHFGTSEGVLPLWIAEPDVDLAPEVTAALRARAGTGWYGYEMRSDIDPRGVLGLDGGPSRLEWRGPAHRGQPECRHLGRGAHRADDLARRRGDPPAPGLHGLQAVGHGCRSASDPQRAHVDPDGVPDRPRGSGRRRRPSPRPGCSSCAARTTRSAGSGPRPSCGRSPRSARSTTSSCSSTRSMPTSACHRTGSCRSPWPRAASTSPGRRPTAPSRPSASPGCATPCSSPTGQRSVTGSSRGAPSST